MNYEAVLIIPLGEETMPGTGSVLTVSLQPPALTPGFGSWFGELTADKPFCAASVLAQGRALHTAGCDPPQALEACGCHHLPGSPDLPSS